MTEAISFGGGVNSVAMTILLVNEGWRGPVVYAETGCEWPETDTYVEMFDREWLQPRGLGVTRIGGEYRIANKAVPLIEYCERRLIVPGMRQRWCTVEWKRAPLQRWAKARGVDTLLIGIAADESHRARADMDCPLCDRLITRDGCKRIIADAGLPIPPKSGCYLCMFQGIEQWRRLWDKHPDLWERVARLDAACIAKSGFSLLQTSRGEPLPLRLLAEGFGRQDTFEGFDACSVEHLRCWACMA